VAVQHVDLDVGMPVLEKPIGLTGNPVVRAKAGGIRLARMIDSPVHAKEDAQVFWFISSRGLGRLVHWGF
jgi:hypothetical protein